MHNPWLRLAISYQPHSPPLQAVLFPYREKESWENQDTFLSLKIWFLYISSELVHIFKGPEKLINTIA